MKLITANKLNRFWKNGILPKLNSKFDKTKVLATAEQVKANTNAENVASAVVTKELYNNLNGNILTYNESEDAYYIQHGADSVPKKLGSNKMSGDFKIHGLYRYISINLDKNYTQITMTDNCSGSSRTRIVTVYADGVNIGSLAPNGTAKLDITGRSTLMFRSGSNSDTEMVGCSYVIE